VNYSIGMGKVLWHRRGVFKRFQLRSVRRATKQKQYCAVASYRQCHVYITSIYENIQGN
jgi:hypothetical protein